METSTMLCCSARGNKTADEKDLPRIGSGDALRPPVKRSLSQHLKTSFLLSIGVTEKPDKRVSGSNESEARTAAAKVSGGARRPSLLDRLLRREYVPVTDVQPPSGNVASSWLKSTLEHSALLMGRVETKQLGKDRRETTRLLDALHAHQVRVKPRLEADLSAIRLGRRRFESQLGKLRRSATVAWEPSDEAISAAWAALLEAEAVYKAALLKRLGPSPQDDTGPLPAFTRRPSVEQEEQLERPKPVRAEAYPVSHLEASSPQTSQQEPRGAAPLTPEERQARAEVAAVAALGYCPGVAGVAGKFPGRMPSPDAPRPRTFPSAELPLGAGAVHVDWDDDEDESPGWPLHG